MKFLARTTGYDLYLTSTKAVFAFPTKKRADRVTQSRGSASGVRGRWRSKPRAKFQYVAMELVDGDLHAQARGAQELRGRTNYFLGNDPVHWRTGIPNYAQVHYSQVYRGVDLTYYGNERHLEYDFTVAPGVNPLVIDLAFRGAHDIRLDSDGALRVAAGSGNLLLGKPHIFQRVGGRTVPVAGRFTVRGPDRVGFQVGTYDHTRPLIIDPTVSPILGYSTFLGGGQDDTGNDIVVDSSGNAYIVGSTNSPDFPTEGAIQSSLKGGVDVFVTKLNSSGTALVYSTFLGGSSDDHGEAIAIDSAGDAYITGDTASTDFPTVTSPAPLQACVSGGAKDVDAFAAKLNASGNALLVSTCIGGTLTDHGFGIAVDASGNIYVSGDTASTDFPVTTGSFQATFGGGTSNGFLTEVKADGSALAYSSYLGGSGDDHARAIAVDSSGNVYLTGNTTSPNFPTSSTAFQAAFGGSGTFTLGDAFLTELKPSGTGSSDLVYSTYLGGANDDAANAIALASTGNVYLTGLTFSTRFPTKNPYQAGLAGGADAFVAELNPAASGSASLVYSTYFGGSGNDQASSIALDSAGNIYLTGSTSSFDFPTAGAFQPLIGSFFGGNAFYVKLSASGAALIHSSFLGGQGSDVGRAIAVDSQGNAYITGNTASANFPATTGAFETTFGGAGALGLGDAFATKVLPSSTVTLSPTTLSFGNLDAGSSSSQKTITLTNGGDASLTISSILASGPFTQSNNCPSTVSVAGTCTINVVFTPSGAGAASGQVSITDNAGDSPQVAALSGTGVAFALSASTTTAQVSPGQSANYTLSIAPNGFSGSVAFTCGGAPAGANCTITPTTVNLDGSTAATATVQVTTTAHSILLPGFQPNFTLPLLAIFFFALLALVLLDGFLKWQRREVRRLSHARIVLIVFLALGGCGCSLSNSTSGTPAGTYTLTVNGTSGGLTKGVNLTLTIQ